MMGKYTVAGGDTDEAIDKRLEFVVPFVRECFPDTASIVLVGGFGRGEGVVSQVDNDLMIHSDFDLYVVRNTPRSNDLSYIVRQIGKTLEKEPHGAGIYATAPISLDLHFLTMSSLRRLPPTIRFFDLNHGSMVLYGDDVPELMPRISPEALPLYEGTRLLINRLYYSCEWFSLERLRNADEASVEQRRKIAGETSKNYIILCYALLVLAGKYDSSAHKSDKQLSCDYALLFPTLYQGEPDLARRALDSVERRLRGNLESNAVAARWCRSLRDLLTVVDFYARSSVGMENWSEFYAKTCGAHLRPYIPQMLPRWMNPSPRSLIVAALSQAAQLSRRARWFKRIAKAEKRLYWPILLDYRDPAVAIYDALLGLFRSIRENGTVERDILDQARKRLKGVYPCGENPEDSAKAFARLTADCVKAYDVNFGKGPTLRRNGVEVVVRATN